MTQAPANPPPDQAHKHPVQLVALDLDGTLLTTQKQIAPKTIQTIQKVIDNGIIVVLASARPPRSVRDIYNQLKLDTLQINYNGALIYDQTSDTHTFHQPIEHALAAQIIAYTRRLDPDVVVSVEILDKWYTDRTDDSLPTETAKTFQPDFIGPLESFPQVPATKLMFLAPPDRTTSLHRAIRKRFANQAAVLTSDPHLTQVVHRTVDKAVALAIIAEHYNIHRSHVMAIGDAPNDTGMIRWAGTGVAVENAWDQVRNAANHIAPSNDNLGVAVALERHALAHLT